MSSYNLTHLKELEAESIYVLREVFAQFQNPAILFSGGKDSIVLTHLARKDHAGCIGDSRYFIRSYLKCL